MPSRPRRAEPRQAPQITNRFDIVVNGVAMVVPTDQVANLARVKGVKAIMRDELLHLDTDRSPAFIDATDRLELPRRPG